MPTESFYKLDKEKRKKIIYAMKKEFSRVPFHEASVNKIVEEAGISKGSFWVYFESKEEAIEYLIENHLEKERKKAKEIFIENKGDIFKSYIGLYDYLSGKKLSKTEKDLSINIFKSLITNSEKFIPKHKNNNIIELTKKMINTDKLNLQEDDDLINLMKMMNFAMRTNLLDLVQKKISKEQAKKRFVRQIEILKKGISK